jgi:hypothetical protein
MNENTTRVPREVDPSSEAEEQDRTRAGTRRKWHRLWADTESIHTSTPMKPEAST